MFIKQGKKNTHILILQNDVGGQKIKTGFSTKEGLVAISGLFGAIFIAIIGFGDRIYLTGLFILLISVFFIIYGKKLCKTCDKSCPCNPNMLFWKIAIAEIYIGKKHHKNTEN